MYVLYTSFELEMKATVLSLQITLTHVLEKVTENRLEINVEIQCCTKIYYYIYMKCSQMQTKSILLELN